MPIKDVQMGLGYRQDAVVPENAPINTEDRVVSNIVFSTGERGLRYDFWTGEQYYEELDVSTTAIRTDRLSKGLSVIDSHRAYAGIDGVFGITENYRIENGEIVGDARFATDEDSDVVFRKVQDRVLRHVSLGYKIHQMRYMGDAEDGIPIYRAVDWEPTELSFVPVSFETTNGVRSDNNTQQPTNVCKIDLEDDKMRLPFQLMTRGAYGSALQDPEPGTGGAAPAPTPAPAAPAEQPQQRAQEPTPAPADTRSMSSFMASAKAGGLDADEAVRAFDAGMSLADFNAEVLAKMSKRSQEQAPGVPLVGERTDQAEVTREDFAAGLAARATGQGWRELTDAQRQFANVPLAEAFRHYERVNGRSVDLGSHQLAYAGRALHTTSDLPLILENVMNKSLLPAYEAEQRTFERVARRSTANDFRAKNTYKMGDAPNLLPLGEHGEYKYGTFSESKESYRLSTYARKLGFTRQMFINDDLSALSRFPSMFAQSAVRLENDIVWGLILNYDFIRNQAASHTLSDGQPLFASQHANVLTGQGSALSLDTLSRVRKLGRDQKTLDNNILNVDFNVLAVGTGLETQAQRLLTGIYTPDTADNVNIFRNSMDLVIEPRINMVTGGETAQYYFSDRIRAIEYAYLAGNEGLYTEVQDGTDVDGTTILARHDFGAGFEDYRGAARAAGA